MSSLQPTTHKALTFDILGAIFSYYASEETIHHPLETMLLVSRSWADAALGHRTLWSDLKIYFGHNPTSKIWEARLPLRLARAGPTTLLDIDLRNYLDMPHSPQAQRDVQNDPLFSSFPCHRNDDADGSDDELCTCYDATRASVQKALEKISGKSGELCIRWRSLELDLGHTEQGINGTELVAIPLSYPTPQLTILALRNVYLPRNIAFPVFPCTPELKVITIGDCNLPSLPRCNNIRQATIGWEEKVQTFPDLSAFRHATRLETLRLHIPPVPTAANRICLPDQLNGLRVLYLKGNDFPPQLYSCQMPILSSLVLKYQFTNLLAYFLRCEGFVPENLRRFTLLWDLLARPTSKDISSTFTWLHTFLSRTRNLESITAEKEILNILLKLIWFLARVDPSQGHSNGGPLVDDIWINNCDFEERVYLRGDETQERLEEIANDWNLVPLHGSLEEFISRLRVSSPFSNSSPYSDEKRLRQRWLEILIMRMTQRVTPRVTLRVILKVILGQIKLCFARIANIVDYHARARAQFSVSSPSALPAISCPVLSNSIFIPILRYLV
jgi:hypothetical protein